MIVQICRLCELKPPIKNSHIIPALVCREIKKKSPTGFLRSAQSPNKREQDSDTYPLLCVDCEGLFSKYETKFNNYIFKNFRDLNQVNLEYGEWLHYYITSVTWRILIHDIEITDCIPSPILSKLKIATSVMRQYLLGDNKVSDVINNHAFFLMPDAQLDSMSLSEAIPTIRQSTFGYTIWMDNKFSAVSVNFAGLFCVTHIQLNPKDIWHNTKIYPAGGKFVQPQKVDSWIAAELFTHAIEVRKSGENLTEKQRTKIENAIKKSAIKSPN